MGLLLGGQWQEWALDRLEVLFIALSIMLHIGIFWWATTPISAATTAVYVRLSSPPSVIYQTQIVLMFDFQSIFSVLIHSIVICVCVSLLLGIHIVLRVCSALPWVLCLICMARIYSRLNRDGA